MKAVRLLPSTASGLKNIVKYRKQKRSFTFPIENVVAFSADLSTKLGLPKFRLLGAKRGQ